MFRFFAGLLLAAPMFAGGFFLTLGNPAASHDPAAKDAVMIVRPDGCHEPQKAIVRGTAEGLINGKRVSVPLHMVALSQPGMYAVKREWPAEGNWVLRLEAQDGDRHTSAIVKVHAGGFDRKGAKYVMAKASNEDVESALRR